MKTKRALARLRFELVSLFLEFGFAVAALVIIVIAVPTILIFAAQLQRLTTTGGWRGFTLSELVDVLRIDASTLGDESQQFARFVLALPATLMLSLAALVLGLVAYGLHRLIQRKRTRLSEMRQSALIEDIERQLDGSRQAKS